MVESVHLIGAEEVSRAGSAMREAAETMSRAASSIDTSVSQQVQALAEHQMMMQELLTHLTNPKPEVRYVQAENPVDGVVVSLGELSNILRPLVSIANAYDENSLDDGARKFWGSKLEHENQVPPKDIELYQGRGGKRLLTLQDCLNAREFCKKLGWKYL